MSDIYNYDLNDFNVKLNIFDEVLSEIHETSKLKQLEENLFNECRMQLVKHMKEDYPDYPDEILLAFVTQFFDLEIKNDYNFQSKERTIIVKPTWKDHNLINFDSKEQKLLDDYFLTN